jgi:calcium-dependent protein kinase
MRTSVGKGIVPVLGSPLPSSNDQEEMDIVGTSYYIAPEILERNYNESADIWSLGCILFLMLTGVPPFNGDDDEEILAKVRLGKFSVETLIDAGASDEAIDLIDKMMEFNKDRRITAEQAQSHPWITKNICKEKAKVSDTNNALLNLRSFKMTKKL